MADSIPSGPWHELVEGHWPETDDKVLCRCGKEPGRKDEGWASSTATTTRSYLCPKCIRKHKITVMSMLREGNKKSKPAAKATVPRKTPADAKKATPKKNTKASRRGTVTTRALHRTLSKPGPTAAK